MSKFLEDRMRRRLEIAYEDEAERLAIPLADVQRCPPLFLRQVSIEHMYVRYRNNVTFVHIWILGQGGYARKI